MFKELEDSDDTSFREANLCVLYGDHDECPATEIDKEGRLVACDCSCHLDPDADPK